MTKCIDWTETRAEFDKKTKKEHHWSSRWGSHIQKNL